MKVETQPLYTFVAMKALELARIEIQIASSHVESRLEGEDCLSLLDAAVSNKDHRMMDLLFENGAVANDHHCPPASSYLFRAIRIDDPTMVRTLIDHGAGPMCVDPSAHREPVFIESLRCAVRHFCCNQEVVECLLTRAPYNLTPHWSELLTETLFISHNRRYKSIERLLFRRMGLLANTIKSSEISISIEELDEVSRVACEYKQLAVVRALLEHNILKFSTKIAQAFQAAVRSGCYEMVQTLLENGVEVDMPLDDLGTTALALPSERGHANIVRLLLHHGAEFVRQYTALFLAAREGHVAVVQMLLDAGAVPSTHHDNPGVSSQWGTAPTWLYDLGQPRQCAYYSTTPVWIPML